MIQALLAAIGYAGGISIDKILISREKISQRIYLPLGFLLLTVITALFLPKFGNINWSAFSFIYFLVFVLLILVAVTWNRHYYTSIQKESLHEFELIMLLSPIVTIILAMILLPNERNMHVIVAGLIASGVFVWSRFKSHHLQISLTEKGTIYAMILMSLESILIKELLNVFSPVSLYFIRTLIVAVVFILMYKPDLLIVPKKMMVLTTLSAGFGVLQMVLKFYGFASLGVIETTMILLLGPFFVYLFSYFYFHETANFKKDLSCAVVVIACIIYGVVIK